MIPINGLDFGLCYLGFGPGFRKLGFGLGFGRPGIGPDFHRLGLCLSSCRLGFVLCKDSALGGNDYALCGSSA